MFAKLQQFTPLSRIFTVSNVVSLGVFFVMFLTLGFLAGCGSKTVPAFDPIPTADATAQFALEWQKTIHTELMSSNWRLLTAQERDFPGLKEDFEQLQANIDTTTVPPSAASLKNSALSLTDALIRIAGDPDINKLGAVTRSLEDYRSVWVNFTNTLDIPTVIVDRDLGVGRLLFMCNPNGNYEVCTSDPDGSNQTVITSSESSHIFPTISPDGNYIIYYSNRDDSTDIYVSDADGSNEKNLTNGKGGIDPSWSPSGEFIAFASSRDGGEEFQIYLMDASGGNVTQLTTGKTNRHPVWDPTAKQIAYISSSSEADTWEIFVMDADGTNATQLTQESLNIGYLSWSPNGKQIAFLASEGDDDTEIYVMNNDGSDLRQLTDNDIGEIGLAWSPDGAYILYSSDFYFSSAIFIMIADGSSSTVLIDARDQDEIISQWLP